MNKINQWEKTLPTIKLSSKNLKSLRTGISELDQGKGKYMTIDEIMADLNV